MQVSLIVCNVCQDLERKTMQYELRRDGQRVKVDLCEEHSAYLETLFGHATEARPTSAQKAPAKKAAPRRRANVVSLEEIEREKAATKA